jgi:hypothetical protein
VLASDFNDLGRWSACVRRLRDGSVGCSDASGNRATLLRAIHHQGQYAVWAQAGVG